MVYKTRSIYTGFSEIVRSNDRHYKYYKQPLGTLRTEKEAEPHRINYWKYSGTTT